MMYQLKYSPEAQKDAKKLSRSHLKEKCLSLLGIIEKNPHQSPPPYERLVGDLEGCFSRRINIQHRLVYTINEPEKIVRILRMWSHYE